MTEKISKHAVMDTDMAGLVREYGRQNDLRDSQVIRLALREFFTTHGWALPGPQGSQIVPIGTTGPMIRYPEAGE